MVAWEIQEGFRKIINIGIVSNIDMKALDSGGHEVKPHNQAGRRLWKQHG